MSDNQAPHTPARRPLATRQAAWAPAAAGALVRMGLTPNQVSIASVIFAAGGGAALAGTGVFDSFMLHIALFIATAVLIQLRLLCNLFDGLMAVEGGLGSPAGEMYNDLPDRFADAFLFIGAGYAAAAPTFADWSATLGWCAALIAVLIAYVRVLGSSAGAKQFFIGPMAKQHRMALLTFACILAAGESIAGFDHWSLPVALVIVILGGTATIVHRLMHILRELEA